MATKGPDNYDFAGLRINTGPLPARERDKEPTRAEVLRAKRNAVGEGGGRTGLLNTGKRDRCRKGKSCSATCIAASKDCLVELPVPIQRELRRLALSLIARGETGAEESLADKRLGASILQLSKATKKRDSDPNRKRTFDKDYERKTRPIDPKTGKPLKDPKTGKVKSGKKVWDPDIEFGRLEKSAKASTLSWKEVLDLKKRKDLLGDAEFNEQAMKFLQKDAFGRGLRLRKNELEAIYRALPEHDRKSLERSGSAGKQWWAGKDENGNDKFSTSPTKERGLAVLDMWFRQGGTDAYRFGGGRIRAPMDYDVEHVRPINKGGADAPSNWILARSGSQQARGAKKLGDWIDELPKNRQEYREYLQKKVGKRNTGDLEKAAIKLMDPAKIAPADLVGMNNKQLAYLFANPGKSSLTALKLGWYPAKGGVRANSGPPAPIIKGLALALQENRPQALKLADSFQKEWNAAITSGQGPTQAFNSIVGQLRNALPADRFALIEPLIAQGV